MDVFETFQMQGGALLLVGELGGLLVHVLEKTADDADESGEDEVEGKRRSDIESARRRWPGSPG